MGKTHNHTAAISRWASRFGMCAALALALGCSTLGEGPEESHSGPDAAVSVQYPDAGTSPPTPSADAAPPAPQPDAGPPSGLDDEQSLFETINEERAARGLSVLVLRADLTCAARAHAVDIGTTETCAMVGSGGETPSDRVEACGGDSTTGAVVGCGYFTAGGTVNGWIDNEDIAPYLLAPAYESVGVGWHNDYWVAIFDS